MKLDDHLEKTTTLSIFKQTMDPFLLQVVFEKTNPGLKWIHTKNEN